LKGLRFERFWGRVPEIVKGSIQESLKRLQKAAIKVTFKIVDILHIII